MVYTFFESSSFRNNIASRVVPSFNYAIKNTNLWHYRMGHLSEERLNILKTKHPYIFAEKLDVCDTCHRAKQKKLSFALSKSVTVKSFELLHIDIWGPCSTISMRSFRYFLTIVDDFARYTWVILLHTKFEVRNHILKFIAYTENQFRTTVQIVRIDNGVDFSMKDFFSSKGIIHQTTCVETHEQNDIVERKHQHILNVTRALPIQANLPPLFWDFVVQHVALLIYCISTPFLHNTSSYEKLNGKLFLISLVYVFLYACVTPILLLPIERNLCTFYSWYFSWF